MLNAKKASKLRGVIHISVLILLITSLIVLAVFWPKHRYLTNQVETAASTLDSSHPLNKQIETIATKYGFIDNDFREFIIDKDVEKYKRYKNEMKQLLAEMNEIVATTSTEPLLAEIKNNLKIKDSISTLLATLHLDFDTLININYEANAPNAKVSIIPYNTESVLKSVEIDTLKSKPAGKKKLLGRLADAFKNKNNIQLETVILKMKLNKKEHYGNFLEQMSELGDNINAYYKNVFTRLTEKQKLIKEKELQLVAANRKILRNTDKLLGYLKAIGKGANKSIYQKGIDEANAAGRNLRYIITTLSVLLVVSILLLLFYTRLVINNEKQLTAEKENSEHHAKMKEHLLATMSHEIRTPVTSITAFSEQLQNEQLTVSQNEMVDAISFSAHSLMNIINSTLDFLKTAKGALNIIKSTFNPVEEIGKVASLLKILACKKQIQLELKQVDNNNLLLFGDVNRLHQVMYNLVGNAIKFTNKGKVTVATSISEQALNKYRLQVEVTDTGNGIELKDVNLIFERYYQLSDGKNTKNSSGLGLAICKELIELQGGKISVSSKIGVGSIFSFYIDYEAASIDKKVVNENVTVGNSKTVFIVDDDLFQLSWIKMALTKNKFNCITFSSAKEALEAIEAQNPVLIFSDINMLEMSGTEFLKKALEKYKTMNLSFIACTGDDDENVKHYLELGFKSVLMKPFTEKDLLQTLQNFEQTHQA